MNSQASATVVMESVEEYNDPIKTRVKQLLGKENNWFRNCIFSELQALQLMRLKGFPSEDTIIPVAYLWVEALCCLLYTSPSPRDGATSRMPSSA